MRKKGTPDNQGNHFETEEQKGWLTIYLKLASDKRFRELGKVCLKERTLEIVRSKQAHLFKKNESYGFNEALIKNAQKFDKVKLTDDDGTYLFPKSLILTKGSYLHFKSEGFERQLFLPLKEIREYKIDCMF